MEKSKKTEEEIQRLTAQLKEEIDTQRQRAHEQGLSFAALKDEQLAKKLRGEMAKSPFIYMQSWGSAAAPGGFTLYHAWVKNPDPTAYDPVYVTIFFGLGNIFGANDAWIGRDKRWVEFSSDRTYMPANSTHQFSLQYPIPDVPRGTYNGNSIVWRGEWQDTGQLLDRGSFDMKVT